MAKVYADLIRKGLKTVEDVPVQLRADVEALLAGRITQEQYREITGEEMTNG